MEFNLVKHEEKTIALEIFDGETVCFFALDQTTWPGVRIGKFPCQGIDNKAKKVEFERSKIEGINMKHIEIAHIKVHAVPGNELGICIQEAVQLAIKEWQNVLLLWNGKEHKISVNDLLNIIIKESAENKEELT